jgi:ATP synthase subunit 6
MFFLNSPLEQFAILPFFLIRIGQFDFSITNSTMILTLGMASFLFFAYNIFCKLLIIPGRFQVVIEDFYEIICSLVVDNIGVKGMHFFSLIFSLFLTILISNLTGLVPYSFTTTSHLIITFYLGLSFFLAINIIGVRIHGNHFFCLFLPQGSDLMLAPLLIPIEIISYIFRPISLSVRLFANMMAGHTLLKVIVGFAWSMMACTGVTFVAHIIPLIALVALVGLELAVACIQTYVFVILTCIYFNDALNLH